MEWVFTVLCFVRGETDLYPGRCTVRRELRELRPGCTVLNTAISMTLEAGQDTFYTGSCLRCRWFGVCLQFRCVCRVVAVYSAHVLLAVNRHLSVDVLCLVIAVYSAHVVIAVYSAH
eukprot:2997013-Rhodomonas_salina.1